MKLLRSFWGFIIILVVSVILGFCFLILSYRINSDSILDHVKTSSEILAAEGDYYSITPKVMGSKLDNYTDCVMLNESLFFSTNWNEVINYALGGYEYYSEDGRTKSELLLAAADEGGRNELKSGPNLNRFWNGYVVLLKIALCFMNYSWIRYVNFNLQLILIGIFAVLLYKRNLFWYSIPLLISYIFINPITMGICFIFSMYFYCAVLPCIIILLFHEKLAVENRYRYLFAIVGIVTSYFCMNYIQLLTLVYPLTIYYLIDQKTENSKKKMLYFLELAFWWAAGYYGMMFAKWIVYGLFINWDIINNIISSVFFRLSANNYGTEFTRIDAVLRNLVEGLLNRINIMIEIMFILICLISICKKRIQYRLNKTDIIVLTISFALPIMRYFIFANHVFIHYWVMYRLMVIPILTLDIFLVRIIMNCGKDVELSKTEGFGVPENEKSI
ncbi:MAG: hypothetical protein K6E85_09140 [Lachnospiraceae bacterium]|nr:hypothetical protein [Lachnospiraceae bacterium]